MKIYNYHPIYKVYVGFSNADESPLEPGIFLIPANSTAIEPPECSQEEIQVFDGNSWTIAENHYGTCYSTTNGREIFNENPLIALENTTKKIPPEVPDGYILEWNNNDWNTKPIPIPPELTPQQKLENAGLTVQDLKDLLGI